MDVEERVKWRGKKSSTECLHYLCLSERLADVWLTFKDDPSVRMPAHKFVLCMRSEVFEVMFDNPLPEASSELYIEDINTVIMEQLLRFLYTDELNLNVDNVFSLLYVAKKYVLEGLHDQCVQFLAKSVEATNVCDIYESVQGYDVENIVSATCLDYVWRHAWKVFATEDFLKISAETLSVILDSDNLTGEEISTFRAVMKWAEHQCISNNEQPTPENLQTCIKDTVYKIRFPLMSIEEFMEEVQSKGVLSPEDSLLLHQYISEKDCDRKPGLETFNVNPRNGGIMTEQIFNAYPIPDRVQGGCDQIYIMTIMTNEDIRLRSMKGPLINYIKAVKMCEQPRPEIVNTGAYQETRARMLKTEDIWKPANYSVLQDNDEIIFTHDPLLMPDSYTYMRIELFQIPVFEGQNNNPVNPPPQRKRARGARVNMMQNPVVVSRVTNMSLIIKKTYVTLDGIPPGITQMSFR